jgi:hypothetical protein
MIDPLTLVLIGVLLGGVLRVAQTRAEADVLRARAELARAVAQLPPRAEIDEHECDGGRSVLPSAPSWPGVEDGH